MFGPDISHSKGKSTRSSPRPVKQDDVAAPKEIHQKNKEIAFHVDTTCVNGLPFLTSVGHPICFRGCKSIDSTVHDDCCKASDKAFWIHNQAGFGIKTAECNGECSGMMDKVSDGLLDVKMNCTNAQEHESRSEQNKRTMKEAF